MEERQDVIAETLTLGTLWMNKHLLPSAYVRQPNALTGKWLQGG
jgi:hypothetical protein